MEESELYRAAATRRQLEAALGRLLVQPLQLHRQRPGSRRVEHAFVICATRSPGVLGNFEQSVVRMGAGPAMLDYLDQSQNRSRCRREPLQRELLARAARAAHHGRHGSRTPSRT